MDLLNELFGESKNDLTAWQMSARALVVFAYGLILVRLAGRRIFGRWSALDIVVSVIIGSNLSRALTGNAPLLAVLVSSSVLVAVHWLLAAALAHWRPLSRLIEGRPIYLGKDGAIDWKLLKRRTISEADMHEALRQAGVPDENATKLITLEPSGKISVIKA
ncbi:MAG TPA: YetF domain-containing protein [Caulobacteraceae bacterium]|jgi:uncharacterized membrane protein YcaP (DUF421 family)